MTTVNGGSETSHEYAYSAVTLRLHPQRRSQAPESAALYSWPATAPPSTRWPTRRLSLGALAGRHLYAPADVVRPQVQAGQGAFGVRPLSEPGHGRTTLAGQDERGSHGQAHRTAAPGSRPVCRRRSHGRERRRAQPVDDIAVLAARARDRQGADRGRGDSELTGTAGNSGGDCSELGGRPCHGPVFVGRVPVSSPHASGPRARPVTYRARPHPGHDTGPRPPSPKFRRADSGLGSRRLRGRHPIATATLRPAPENRHAPPRHRPASTSAEKEDRKRRRPAPRRAGCAGWTTGVTAAVCSRPVTGSTATRAPNLRFREMITHLRYRPPSSPAVEHSTHVRRGEPRWPRGRRPRSAGAHPDRQPGLPGSLMPRSAEALPRTA